MEKTYSLKKLFLILASFCLMLGALGVISTALGVFYGQIFSVLICSSIGVVAFWLGKNFRRIKWNKSELAIILISLLFVVSLCFFVEPSIFSGRDQGSLSEAAIRLSQNHQLTFSFQASDEFFGIYGLGKALNFPGFVYEKSGDLSTQFPIGYIAWLAIFFSTFGLFGLVIANAIPLFIFLVSFCFLTKLLTRKDSLTWIVFLLALSSFAFSWFFKFTLSENLALAFLWLGIWQFMDFLEKEQKFNLIVALFSLGFLFFVRVETIAFGIVMFFLAWLKFKKQKEVLEKIKKYFLVFFSAYVVSIFWQQDFYWGFLKNLLKPFLASESKSVSGGVGLETIFSLKVLSAYAVLNLIILGVGGFLWFVRKKDYQKIFPFFILLPSFIYLIDPNISNDHPWMLRRFLFSIIPLVILYAVLFIDVFLKRKFYLYFFSGLLVITNLLVSFGYFSFVPYSGLTAQIKSLSYNFGEKDLILVDREASGDPLAMISGPLNFLFKKQAVYFFNPKDIDKINRNNFSNIYFIIPDNNLDFYKESDLLVRLEKEKDYSLNFPYLKVLVNQELIPQSKIFFPEKTQLTVSGGIYRLK